jgi:hypothetical protein
MGDLIAMMTGGVAGGTLMSAATRTPTTAGNAFRASRPAYDIAVHPVTGEGVSNRVADEASQFMKALAQGDPKDVAAAMAARIAKNNEEGLPHATSDILVDDIGLASLGKRKRTQIGSGTAFPDPDLPTSVWDQNSFVARDKQQGQAAVDQVRSVLPPEPDPAITARAAELRAKFDRPDPPKSEDLFQGRAGERAQMELEARQREIDQAKGGARGVQQAREEAVAPVRQQVGATPDASTSIFDTYANTRTLERDRSNALYANPDYTEHVFDVTPMQQAAAEVRAQAARPGAAPIRAGTEEIIQRIEAAHAAGGAPGSIISKINADIEGLIAENLHDKSLFDQLKELKNSVAQTVTALPTSHPARQAIDAARANTAEVIQPNFRADVGGSLDARLKSNPGQVIPETAGAEFLQRGSGTRQLMDIANLRGNAEEVAANARAIVFDKLAESGAIKNGILDPDALAFWRDKNRHIIREIPGLADEVNGMVASARRGSNTAGQYAEEIAAAEARLKGAQADIKASPVGKLEGKTPQEAVASVMEGPNAAKNMTELRARLGDDTRPQRLPSDQGRPSAPLVDRPLTRATQSLKDSVSRYFVDRVSKIDTRLEGDAGLKPINSLISDFNKHRATLVAAGFTSEEMNALQRAQTILKGLVRRNVQATVGSTTAESSEAVMKPLELALKMHYGTLKGGSVFRNVKVMLKLAKGDVSGSVEELLTRAMFEPELAMTLLTRDVKKAGTPAWNAELQKLMRRNEIIKDVARDDEPKDEQVP